MKTNSIVRIKKTSGFLVAVFIILLTGCARQTDLQIPEISQVSAIQVNTLRNDRVEGDRIEAFLKGMSEAAPVKEKESILARQEANDIYVTFYYKEEQKELDTYRFFQADGEWYLEDREGMVYENAGCIEDYIEITEAGGNTTTNIILPSKQLILLGAETEYDIRYRFALLAESRGESMTMNQMKLEEIIYQYALENGYELSSEEQAEWIESRQADKAENYEEAQAQYQEMGISLQEAIEGTRELEYQAAVRQKLYDAKYEEFRRGENRIGDTECGTVEEYWNTFIQNVIFPSMEEYDMTAFEAQAEEAEQYYLQWKTRK